VLSGWEGCSLPNTLILLLTYYFVGGDPLVFDVLKKGLKTLAHGAKVFSVSVAASIALNRKRNELKRVLLSRFKVEQLDEIAVRAGISLKGTRSKKGKIEVLAAHLSFNDVVKLAKRYKVKCKDILEELDRFKAQLEAKKAVTKTESQVENIIQALREFKPEPVRDEEDLEKQLYQYLKAKFPRVPIKRQVKLGDYRIDMQIGPCGIELKIPKSSTHLQRLIGQIRDYGEYLDCMAVLILDTGKVRDLSSYTQRLEEMGIIPVAIEGKLKK